MYSHSLEDGIVLLEFEALGRILAVLGGDVAGSAGHTACLMFGALEYHLHSIAFSFLCHSCIYMIALSRGRALYMNAGLCLRVK